MNTRRSSAQSGFTLIELLIVVAIIGIIAAVAIPELLAALQRARQSKTMSDIRTLAQAIEIYNNDIGFYPRIGSGVAADVVSYVTPQAMERIPTEDGWANAIIFQTDGSGASYTLISYGRNGAADPPYVFGVTTRFDDDIVMFGGRFVQWPEGTQTNS